MAASSPSVSSVRYVKMGSRQHSKEVETLLDEVSKVGEVSNDSNQEEDYDKIHPDSQHVVHGSHRGGYKADFARTVHARGKETDSSQNAHRQRDVTARLSIDVQNSEFLLQTDGNDLKEIIKDGVDIKAKFGSECQKKKFKDIAFTRQFTLFDRQSLEKTEVHGFFTLFWLGTAIFMAQIVVKNYLEHGNILGTNEVWVMMARKDLAVLAWSDGTLWLATGFSWMLQRVIAKGWVRWDGTGWIVQQYRAWPWSHTFFFVMHSLVMLMKMHSYSRYNGHLSEISRTREALLKTLKHLEHRNPPQQSGAGPATQYESTLGAEPYLNSSRYSSVIEMAVVRKAIDAEEPLDLEQIQAIERMIKWEVSALAKDLQGKASSQGQSYPNNLTLKNHYEWTLLPTLVYDLEYPRTDSINWSYVLEKTLSTIGCLFIMQLVSQTYVYPVVVQTNQLKEIGLSRQKILAYFPQILSDLIFPLMLEYIMTWYVLFESILNLLAELTYFGDRGFYADWWNSTSWDQYARDWNKPVHTFLLRHVYHSSISTFHVSRHTATMITFLLSAAVHELMMWCVFKKFRGYLALMQLSQLPLVMLSRTKWLKGKKGLGNLIFWIGLFTGPSVLATLYLCV